MARQANYGTQVTQAVSPSSGPGGIPASIMGPRLVILLSVLALTMIGFVMVYSSSSIAALHEGESTEFYLIRQLGFAVVGIIGCVVLWKFIPYHVWTGPFTWIIWAGAVGLLGLTALIGTTELGAQRWVNIGPISLQPAEFAKIAFLVMAARILYDYRNGDLAPKAMFVQAFVLIILPLLLLYRSQSDLGTTLICFVGILTVMWLGEVPLRVIGAILGAGLAFAVVASLVGYRQERFVFLDPWNDGMNGLDSGYQLIHSFYAFAEGGLLGVGLGNSREKFLYLPEAETDFIYAIIGEELGLLGALLVVVLFLLFLYAGIRIARSAPDNFGTLIAGGFTVMIAFQAFLNIGCVIGVLPTTGKPLPFISSGGSSLIASLFMFGFILSVSHASNTPSIYEQRRADLRVVRAQGATRPASGRKPSASRGRPSSKEGSTTAKSPRTSSRNEALRSKKRR